ncbi:KAP family P-loop NTPase fold protein [Psychrobacter celer]|uniref:KAP family P-loop NTPase fold protein n=2 Tax=Psychrobacter celer TaxID=306572 RepID=UPI003FD27838
MYKDKPIENAEEDLLNRADFSNSLADAILKWRNKESWIIALTGDWGIGKTSVKNLVVNRIKTTSQNTRIIEFKPWEWSSQDLIMSAFFKEVASELELRDTSKKYKRLAEKFRKYSYYLNNIQIVASPTVKGVPLLLGILLGCSFFIEIFPNNFSLELLSNLIISVLAVWLVFVDGLGGLFKSMVDRNEHLAKENSQSVTDFKKDIAESLSKINDPILIIIDDIDRLQRYQILTVMQLVKSNADFENIVFLLLYSKSVLEKKITDNTQTGHEYMEKIVQVEFKVPEPDVFVLRRYLIDNLDLILDKLKHNNFEHIFDNSYFADIFYQQGLANYFTNLRSVYKFLNSFEFNLLSQLDSGYLEINFVDFMVLETFRIFEPKLYSAIYTNKDLMLGRLQNIYSFTDMSDERKKDIANTFIKDFGSSHSANLLKTIFPAFHDYIQESFDTNSLEEKLIKNMISHESRFDRYFMLNISANNLSTYRFIDFFDNLENDESTKTYLDNIYEHNKFDSFIEHTFSYLDKIPNNLINKYFNSLNYLYNLVSDEGMISNKTRVSFLFLESLKKFKNEQHDILRKFIDENKVSSLLPTIYSRIEKRNENYSITEQEINTIQHQIATNIESFIKNQLEAFVKHERRVTFLLFWYSYDQSRCKDHISYLLYNPENFFQI